MAWLDELLLGKTRARTRFDPAQPEGAFKLCGCRLRVIPWDRERCASCEGRPAAPTPVPVDLRQQPPAPLPAGDRTRLETPLPPPPDLTRGHPVIRDRTTFAPDASGEVTITLRLRPGRRLQDSPTVRLTVGDQLVMLVERGEVSPQANGWWEVAVGQQTPAGRR